MSCLVVLSTIYFWWPLMSCGGKNLKMSHQDQDVKIFFQPAIKIFQIYFTQHDIWKFVHKIDSLIKWFRSRSHYTPLGKFYSSALCFVNQKLQHLKWFSGTLKLSYVNVVSSFSKLPGGWLTHSTSRKLGVKGKNLRKIESCFLCEIRRAGGGGWWEAARNYSGLSTLSLLSTRLKGHLWLLRCRCPSAHYIQRRSSYLWFFLAHFAWYLPRLSPK